MTEPGEKPISRYERAREIDARRRRQEAHAFLQRRPLAEFLVVRFAWGCLGALIGILLLDSWVWATFNFVAFAGSGIVAREFIRRRYGGAGSGPGETAA